MLRLAANVIALSIALSVTAVLVIVLAQQFGVPTQTAAGFAPCNGTFCWYDIIPEETRFPAADRTLARLGYHIAKQTRGTDVIVLSYRQRLRTGGCEVQVVVSHTVITELYFPPCNDMRAGDIMAFVGVPDEIDMGDMTYQRWTIRIHTKYTLTPSDGSRCLEISPSAKVDFMLLGTRSQYAGTFPIAVEWHGFMPYWQYTRLYGLVDCHTMLLIP